MTPTDETAGQNDDPATTDNTPTRWLTAEETAAILRVHVTTVHDMCRRGDLAAIKAGRDWRISARGLVEKAELGEMHYKLIHETAELAAEKTAQRIFEMLVSALSRELSRQNLPKAMR